MSPAPFSDASSSPRKFVMSEAERSRLRMVRGASLWRREYSDEEDWDDYNDDDDEEDENMDEDEESMLTDTDDTESNDSDESDEPQPQALDEPWLYTFEKADKVWVRTSSGDWHPGYVCSSKSRTGRTKQSEKKFYCVIYSKRFRKYFAPLNGEIKPDVPHTRKLLREAGIEVNFT